MENYDTDEIDDVDESKDPVSSSQDPAPPHQSVTPDNIISTPDKNKLIEQWSVSEWYNLILFQIMSIVCMLNVTLLESLLINCCCRLYLLSQALARAWISSSFSNFSEINLLQTQQRTNVLTIGCVWSRDKY